MNTRPNVITKAIKRDILSLKPRQKVKVQVTQLFGISTDESGRAARIIERVPVWTTPEFPLIDKRFHRYHCIEWLKQFPVPHEVPRSACVFCPFHSNDEWRRIKSEDPQGWRRAVEVDAALRSGVVHHRNVKEPMYVHRSCVPLEQVDLSQPQQQLFFTECEGMCGV